ncbi:MAG: translocation protein TolB [Lentisphaerae bacterium ADurb.BinA184]|nr:MAG: translocation protein TolB [Lentisphaerae bacterium ADurb.BinA184]
MRAIPILLWMPCLLLVAAAGVPGADAADLTLVSRDLGGNVGQGNSGYVAFHPYAAPVANDGSALFLTEARLDPALDTNPFGDVYRAGPDGTVTPTDICPADKPSNCLLAELNPAGDECYLLRKATAVPFMVTTYLGPVALQGKVAKGETPTFVAADWAGESPLATIEQEVNGLSLILLQDLAANPASLTTTASDPAADCTAPAISADGTRIVFASNSSLFTPPGTGLGEIFLYSVATATYERVSNRPFWSGSGADPDARTPDISGDGRVVCFAAGDGGFIAGAIEDKEGLFVVADGVTELCSRAPGATPADADATGPRLNADGRFIVFLSKATNLIPGVNNGCQQVYLFDRDRQTLAALSVNTAGAESDRDCFAPAISANGRYVTFVSSATNLAAGANGLYHQVYRADLGFDYANHAPVAKTVYASGPAGKPLAFSPAASDADGDPIRFSPLELPNPNRGMIRTAQGAELVAGQWYGPETLPWVLTPASGPQTVQFLFAASDGMAESSAETLILGLINPAQGIIVRTSLTSTGGQADAPSFTLSSLGLSADGRHVAFSSLGALVPEDVDEPARHDIYLRDWIGQTTSLASPLLTTGNAYRCVLSGDGRWLAYFTSQGNRILLADLATGQEHPVAALTGIPDAPAISHDGSRIAYAKDGAIFLYERESGLAYVVSLNSQGEPANAPCSEPTLSADGRVVAFVSSATNLSPDNPAGEQAVYARALESATTTLISRDDDRGLLPTARQPSLSRSGRFAALAADGDVWLVPCLGGATPRRVAAGATNPALSADGRFVVLLKADQIHRIDLGTGHDTLVSNHEGSPANGVSYYGIPSATGQFIAFASDAANLVGDDTNGATDVFVADLAPRASQLPVPILPGTASGNEDDTILVDLQALGDETDTPETIAFTVQPPAQGTATVSAAGVLTYIPAWHSLRPGEQRQVVIQYAVSDGESTAESTVTVTVEGRNDPPTLRLLTYPRLGKDETTVQIGLAGTRGPGTLALSDADNDPADLRLIISSLPAVGALSTARGGAPVPRVPLESADLPLTYQTMIGQEDMDTIGFMAFDGTDTSDELAVPVLFHLMTATLNLRNGWNAVSLPLMPDAGSLAALAALSANSAIHLPAWTWDARLGAYVVADAWAPGAGRYVFASGLSEEGLAVPLSGATADTSLVEAGAGWNLLGPLGHLADGPLPPRPGGTAFARGQVWHFADGANHHSDRLIRGTAHWFLLEADGAVDLSLERDLPVP